ncbi:SDR family NAD(P)-dependent oxidoreductase [Herbiconiux daphne]|uniref:SDR family oxidoreductase n=1 Tax=Herbiconiux daphne TaxID=2970914 RepID=A0ABT2H570_9MICO|nr:SDR family oxidoreductase [Herbiconiux daphne]MCS5735080.1 SDR family oxidoreductase [Herbiconiux daphne]
MTNTIRAAGRFENKVALVTGGSHGMGLATAHRLLDEGAQVAIIGRHAGHLKTAIEELQAQDRLLPLLGDVADLANLDDAMGAIQDRFGRLDAVFANAGMGGFKATSEVTETDFDRLVDVNFKGVFFTVQKSLPLLSDGASIVLNASWTIYRGRGANALYSATKAAVHNLARTFASELAPRRIRVNSISPGYIVTGMFDGIGSEQKGSYAAEVAAGRLGVPADIAGAVAFLFSDDGAYVNGQDLVVDGGLVTAYPPA